MLVICSPNARASHFVSDEIRLFAEKRGDQNIIPVLLSGIPNNEAHQPEHEEQKAFPQCLREVMSMPLADSFTDQEVKPMPLAASFIDLDPARDKMDGIKGESRDAKHEGEIEVLSWSLGGNELSF